MPQLPARSTTSTQRLVALLASMLLVTALLPAASAPARAEEQPAGAAASGFLYYKYPTPDPGCFGFGLNVTGGPFFTPEDCGFSVFGITGATSGAVVRVDLVGPDGTTFATVNGAYDAVDDEWSFPINPTGTWPAGWITAVVRVDGEMAGQTRFGHKLLGAAVEVDPSGAPYAPGEDVAVDVSIGQMDNQTDLSGGSRTGVAAGFSLTLVAPGGERLAVPGGPFTADASGSARVMIPGSLTEDLEGDPDQDFEVTLAAAVTDASYADPATGTWAADEAGRASLTLLDAPDRLLLRASYVSSVGWVKPGETYPFRIFVSNATEADASNVSVTISAPPAATFLEATPLQAGESATVSPTSITWQIGTIQAATEAGAMVRTLVVTARAASLSEDPEVVWKDLSSTATLSYDGQPAAISSATHGPKVIPPSGGFETARYGDKPFPVVPVEYVDLERQSNQTWDNDAEKLDTVINDPDFVGSTYNLYQEMSYGQLFPHGTVPSAGIATADFSSYEAGFDFTTPDRTDPFSGATCRGATLAEAPGAIGSAAYDTRIQDGWYQLPGTTEYYGGDWPVFTATTLSIDSACGPLGKSVFDAAQIADPEIDYNQFDSDKDGVVDFFMLVFVGCGGNGPSQIQLNCEYFGSTPPYDNIWPHSSSLEAQFTDSESGLRGYVSDDQLTSLTGIAQCWTDGTRRQYDDCAAEGGSGDDALPVFVRVGPYNVNPETVFQSASVISHEYGHHLGLPDFYNSDGEVYADLNLMAADYSQHMTVFSKQELGWVVPTFLAPGDEVSVDDWTEIKGDTGEIHWQRPDGTPYTLSAAGGDQNVHNGQAYALKLPGRQVIDPAVVPSGTHVWWSGRGNDFGCSPTGGHNLDLALPELAGVPAGTPVTLEFKSSWDIEWDWDYGFVLTTTDGLDFTSQPSENGYTTSNDFNPNGIQCQEELNNGLTGTSGAYQQGEPIVTAARVPNFNDYSHGAPFLTDAYDISELAGQSDAVVRFSYFTDGAFDRPGWFIDDVVVRAGEEVIYSSDLESGPEGDRLTSDGWRYTAADAVNEADHAYYLELRDQSGFDFDGHGQSDRGDTSWQPGVFIEYTDEAHGYGNTGSMEPPAQHYLDSQPIPGSDCVSEQNGNCADVSFTAAGGDSHWDDFVDEDQPEGFVNSFSDDDSAYGDGLWHFDYGCLSLDVTSMGGEAAGPEEPVTGDLVADAVIRAGDGCVPFAYGRDEAINAAPMAVAQARPTEAVVGQVITFDGSGSRDDRTPAGELDYAWELGDGTTAVGQTVHHAFEAPGQYVATLTVTDADGATDSDTVTVTVSGAPDLTVSDITTSARTGDGTAGGRPREGDKVTVTATVSNAGSEAAPASLTRFVLDGSEVLGEVDTPAIAAGGAAEVSLSWDTRGLKGEHQITVTADVGQAAAESDEANNAASLTVTVRGNKVQNGSFEEPNADGSGPAAWEDGDTAAGTTAWSEGGSDGERSASASGTGGNAVLAGVPTWTSTPIEVAAGETLTLTASVAADDASSAPGLALTYLGAAGELLETVRLIDVPLSTDGFELLEEAVTLPPGVARVRVVLFGFSPTDLRTAGTVTFDEVGLYGE